MSRHQLAELRNEPGSKPRFLATLSRGSGFGCGEVLDRARERFPDRSGEHSTA